MADVCIKAFQPAAKLEIVVAVTSLTCRDAQVAHSLAATSAVALGRLLTGAAVLAVQHRLPGSLSVQVVSQSRIKMMYADSTHEGHVRGYAKEPNLAFPLSASERASGRRLIGPAVAPGQLSIIRLDEQGRYSQSSTPLVTGEVDADIQHFLSRSDQVDNAFACDVHLDADGRIVHAGGILVKALPDGDRTHLEALRQRLDQGALTDWIRSGEDTQVMLAGLDREAVPVEAPVYPRWKCRCSYDRVRRSLSLFDISDLMELIEAGEPVSVRCDICAESYLVSVDEIRSTLERMIKAQA